MRVANRKCIRTLSIQHMKSARTRNIITILAIVLTTILFTALFTAGMSMKYGYEQSNFRQVGGYNHGAFKGITRDKVDELKDDPLIKEHGERLMLGAPVEAPFHKTHVEMSYCDANNAKWMFIEPVEGRLPEEETNEAAADVMVLSLLGVEPVIGNEFTMTFMVDGVETTETFTLCGYWEYDPIAVANHVLLPRSRVESILDKLDTQGYDHLAGYWDLDVMFRSANAIEENLKTVLERHGYQSEDEGRDDYVSIGINWGYIAAQLDDGFDITTVLALAAAVMLIIFTGYLIIYNIFQIAVSNDVRFYGLLKTIGTTGRQIKRIILIQACVLSTVGIPVGLAFGYALGRVVTRVVVAEMADGGMMEVYSVNPFIFVGAAVFSMITVLLSCRKPRKMAAKVSPIEALRYTEGSQSRKTVRKAKKGASVLKMAWANLGRNRKKTAVTIISLSLAIVILELTYILSNGFSMDKYLRRMTQDFVLAEASHFQAARIGWGADAAVSEDVIAQIESMEGVTGGRTYGMTSVIQEFVTEDWLRFLKRDSGSGKAMDAYISYREKMGDKLMTEIHLYGMEDFVLDKLIVVDGDISKLKEGGNYVAAVCQMDDYYNVETDSHWAKVGEKISLRYVDKIEYYDPETGEVYAGNEDFRMKAVAHRAVEYKDAEYEVCARVAIPNTLDYRFYGSDEFVMGADTFRKETGTDAILYYAFDCDDDKIDDMEKYMEELTERNDWYDYESKQSYAESFYGMRNMFVFVGTGLGFIVGMIGILNFLNAILTGILTRRKEFAVLQSVGMTGKQLNTMLMTEGIIFAGSSVVITLLMSIVLAPLVRNVLEDMFWFFDYHFTVVPIVAVAPVFALIGASLPLAAYHYVAKKSVVERLREAE